MANVLIDGTTYSTGGQVTAANLNALVTSATFDTGAVDNATTQISGTAIIVKDGGITAAKLSTGAPTWSAGGVLTPVTSINGPFNGTLGATTPNTVAATTTTIAGATAATALTLTQTARTSGALPYIKWTIPTDTAQTASTESPGLLTVTGTRQWATGALALQRENLLVGPTIAFVGASTVTDLYTLGLTPGAAGANATITRNHTLGVLDATSAASPVTGGLIVCAANGTTATSVGIGGGNVSAGGSILSVSPSAGVGYATGAGGTVTQITSKSTLVTINKTCGSITTHNAALAAGGIVTFQVSNSSVAATDVPVLAIKSGGVTSGAYNLVVEQVQAGLFAITIQNISASPLSQAITINFSLIKAVTS